MSETIQIFLNSKTANKYYNNLTSDCLFNLPQFVINHGRTIKASVQSISIPYSFYNVNYTNQKLVYSVNGGADLTVLIPIGNYNSSTLRTYLLSQMTNFTITYSNLNNTFTFTHSANDFVFKSSSTCFEIIGFLENQQYSSTAKNLTSTASINLFTIRSIYVQCNNFLTHNINNASVNNACILASIPLSSGQFSIITYSNTTNIKSIVDNVRSLSLLRIQLTDQDGALIDLNNCHWSAVLQIDIE